MAGCRLSTALNEFAGGQADIPGDAAKQDGRKVAAPMHRDGRRATIRMAETLV